MKIVSLKNIPITPTSHKKVGKKQQMIAPGEIPHLLQFAQARIKPGEVVADHKHDDLCEIFFIESGSGVIKIDGKKYQIKKGSCITVQPHEYHEVENTGDEKLVLTYFAVIV